MSRALIIVADDHPIFRSGVRRYVEGDPAPAFDIVGEFADATGVRAWLEKGGQADAGIIDVQMPAMGSGELIAELAAAGCRSESDR
ncbi:MAG: response regulator [Myxococcota bacterium]